MKKKGFTLVELIAVLAITSTILLMIGGIYVSGVKTANQTKDKADIQNEYRRTFDGLKRSLKDSEKVKIYKKEVNIEGEGNVNSLLIYKNNDGKFIIYKEKSGDTYNLIKAKINSITNEEPLKLTISEKSTISKDIVEITIKKLKKEVSSSEYLACNVSFKKGKEGKSYDFTIDVNNKSEITLNVDGEEEDEDSWNPQNIKMSNFNILDSSDINFRSYGDIFESTFTVNNLSERELYRSINIHYHNSDDLTLNKSNSYNPIPNLNIEKTTTIDAKSLNYVRNSLYNEDIYIINRNGYAQFRQSLNGVEKENVVGIVRKLNYDNIIIIVGGDLNIVSYGDYIGGFYGVDAKNTLNLQNIVIVSDGSVNFNNCAIRATNGIFEVIANNGISINNYSRGVYILGSNNYDLDYYINKDLTKKAINDFAKFKDD
ncbi:PulJ/GspJ family protein [Clostridium chrysemydis]|uniref:PulJ/GspJ family protein n=1 Tax=Clostridium chrysemydis TaxID=2665504 RepID=UPI00188461E9|nr:prepilin-type N-terminal cleavage/methylation domain-containing protein [Clostridium chrysemydis]